VKSYREIREVTSDTVTIPVPKELLHQKVEIILLPIDDSAEAAGLHERAQSWPAGFFDRFAGSLPNFPDIDFEGNYERRDSIE